MKKKSKGGLEISTFQKLYMLSQKKQIFFLQKVALAMLLLLPLSYLLPQTSSIVFILAKSRRGGVISRSASHSGKVHRGLLLLVVL